MKTKTIITIGLIASTTLIQVYGIESAPQRDRGRSSRTVTVTYQEPPPAVETEQTLFGNLSESDLRCLKYGGLQIVDIINSGTVQKNRVQVITVEPYSIRTGAAPERRWIDEYLSHQHLPKSQQFAWFDPRHVLLKWAEFWTTETDASPVLLVMCEF